MRKINGILVVAFSASVLAGCGEDASSDPPANDASTPDDAARDSGNDTRSDAGRDAASGALGAPSGVSAAAVPVVTTVTTLAGSGSLGFADGTGAAASFRFPEGVAVDTAGNVYVGDSENNRIRVITPTGAVTTLAGSGTGAGTGAGAFADGTGTAASFWRPNAVTVDLAGTVYVADSLNNRIRKVQRQAW